MWKRVVSASLALIIGLVLGCGQSTYDKRLETKKAGLKRPPVSSDDGANDTSNGGSGEG